MVKVKVFGHPGRGRTAATPEGLQKAAPLWSPKVGDEVKLVVQSANSGSLVNVRRVRITKITAAGFITVTTCADRKFKFPTGKDVAYQHRTRGDVFAPYRSRLEQLGPDEQNIPDNPRGGQDYARQLSRKGKL